MLFNSVEFIFIFLPLTLILFYIFSGARQLIVLIFASLFFYGFWNPIYVILLLVSIGFNYTIGKSILFFHQDIKKQLVLSFGIALNLILLGYYKYANFFIDNINIVFSTNFFLEQIILPIAISFFTFQQISYLVDTYKNRVCAHTFLKYCLFVIFFPQLIAGPIVQQKYVMDQYNDKRFGVFVLSSFTIGIALFIVGLAKKVLIADNLGIYANLLFDDASQLQYISFFYAWVGSISFSLQLYFDFSGYSDMALGLAMLFGIKLPVNFHSPYKALSIIDFWRRWHMTLSDFLKNYLYIPLGGNKEGKAKHVRNIFIVMLLGGFWHGAGWGFIIWGGLHAVYIVINHFFRYIYQNMKWQFNEKIIFKLFSFTLTFICVVISWVFFRAEKLEHASHILKSMFAFNGITVPKVLIDKVPILKDSGFIDHAKLGDTWLGIIQNEYLLFLIPVFFACIILPSSMSFFGWLNKKNNSITFQPNFLYGVISSLMLFASILYIVAKASSDFLYYQF